MNKQGEIEAGLHRLQREFEVDADVDVVYLFGSYAKGRITSLSDIDIGIVLHDIVPPDSYFNRRLMYMAQCASALKTDRVDVVLLNNAPLLLVHNVISCRRVLFERSPERRVEFEVDRIGRYLDFKPFMEVSVKYMKEKILSGAFFD